ncbi:dTDP-4-dehydrorhamnose reductase [Salinibacter ruber]|uniref:dTDP-4-dehydrorhamnose reductase n=1 Tax=Salinibacter ruber TaxID=146919 RepID=UPI0020733121|nr:dTDP-4-dehydrorhamnose reductase [Salinibacter ruber]
MPDATASVLLLGATGQVGYALRRTLAPLGAAYAPGRAAVDLTDLKSVRGAVRELRPDLVVNAAAYTDVDGAEKEPERAARINAEAPRVLAEAARAVGAWLVHYSTDYVFGGSKRAPYTEADAPSPISVYGRTKRDGEAAIQAVGGRHVILRTSWVYSRRRSNFVRTMLGLARENDRLTVVDDQIGVPTWAGWCAEATASVCERLLADGDAPKAGCYHLAGTGQTSWYGLARAVFAQFGRTDVTVEPVSSGEYETAAPRPAYTVLDSSRIRTAFRVPTTTWSEQLSRFRRHVTSLKD